MEKTADLALKKAMDFLARRDHSEREIRQKLAKKFEPEDVDNVVEILKKRNWLPNDEEQALALAEKVAGTLHRKKKGLNYINGYLRQKGLPPVVKDEELELEKARALVKTKFRKLEDVKDKAGRFLLARGFDSSTVRKVIFEK